MQPSDADDFPIEEVRLHGSVTAEALPGRSSRSFRCSPVDRLNVKDVAAPAANFVL
jgi:hypothetical protein